MVVWQTWTWPQSGSEPSFCPIRLSDERHLHANNPFNRSEGWTMVWVHLQWTLFYENLACEHAFPTQTGSSRKGELHRNTGVFECTQYSAYWSLVLILDTWIWVVIHWGTVLNVDWLVCLCTRLSNRFTSFFMLPRHAGVHRGNPLDARVEDPGKG